jgi:hypothetical protein
MSKGEWVRRALQAALQQSAQGAASDPVARLHALNGPTADIEQMLSEIEADRT